MVRANCPMGIDVAEENKKVAGVFVVAGED
jgi:hypothetical protein